MVGVEKEAQKARITLKAIESLTYTCSVYEPLVQLNQALDSVFSKFKSELPQEEGLVIRPLITKRTKRREKADKQRHEKLSALKLYKKRGRACADSKYRNRVGKRADQLRKV